MFIHLHLLADYTHECNKHRIFALRRTIRVYIFHSVTTVTRTVYTMHWPCTCSAVKSIVRVVIFQSVSVCKCSPVFHYASVYLEQWRNPFKENNNNYYSMISCNYYDYSKILSETRIITVSMCSIIFCA